ncbi:hypothetical protein MMC24_007877 [Lignoscripta atroalba]|nr:hypothetical protein [Lignoscripta atroalba]
MNNTRQRSRRIVILFCLLATRQRLLRQKRLEYDSTTEDESSSSQSYDSISSQESPEPSEPPFKLLEALKSRSPSSSKQDSMARVKQWLCTRSESPQGSPEKSPFASALQAYTYTPPTIPSPLKRITRASTGTPKSPSPAICPLKRKASEEEPPLLPSSPSPAHKKSKRSPSGYAPPSKYAHITNKLVDSLEPHLICVFIGVNPGLRTATAGHAYAHPSNLFWKLLHSSGCTPRRCRPEEDRDLPRLFALGHTNIVTRPTKDAGELSKAEMDASVPELEAKIAACRPEAVAVVGKSIWESVWRARHGRGIRKEEFRYGWQDEGERMGGGGDGEDGWKGARVFVATTTSGLAAGMRPHEKEAVWRPLGEWVQQRRVERGILGESEERTPVEISSS